VDPEIPVEPEVPPTPRLDEVEDRIVAGCPPECDFEETEGTPPAPLDISYNLLQESIQAADERYTQEFTSYFGLPGRPLPTLQQLQQDLRTIEKDTGIKPAILFAILAPPTSAGTDPLQAVPQSSPEISVPEASNTSPPAPQRIGGVTIVTSGNNLPRNPASASPARPNSRSSAMGQPDDELEIVVITPNGTPIRQRVSGITRSQMIRATSLLRQEVSNPGNTDGDRYLQISQRLYDWMIRPVEAELQARNIESIAFVLEPGMRSLPLATLYDGNQFIIEKYSIGLMPNLSLTDTRFRDVRNFALLGMGASTFTNQAPLPTVPVEINTLTQTIWPSGEEYLEDRFTVAELQKQSDRFGIIHLATHADFVQGTPEGSYVQLSDGRLNLNQLRELGWATRNTEENPPVELLTLSACRTAVGLAEDNTEAIIGSELGFAGVAFAAGVKTSLASLWYVSDAATAALMTEFYQTLAQMDVYRSGLLTPDLKPNNIAPLKAEALRQTQLALLRGNLQIQGETLQGLRGSVNSLTLPPESVTALGSDRTFTHPYYWAAFTLIGNPW
jgi:CHAT domain-containing protein